MLRNVGVPLAHGLISIQSTLKGLRKLILNEERVAADLDDMWAVVAEAIQTILRREAYPHPYEALKALTLQIELTMTQTEILGLTDLEEIKVHYIISTMVLMVG